MRHAEESAAEYVTVILGGQLFGLPILRVHDVFMLERVTRVPLAPGEVAGVLNLRGRIVTAIDLRGRLGLPAPGDQRPPTAIGIECHGEHYALLVDAVGEVITLVAAAREPNPVNLDPAVARISAGIHRLERQLLVVLDVDRALDIGPAASAADVVAA
jgi:purine-binding chemotaxis protein CheW